MPVRSSQGFRKTSGPVALRDERDWWAWTPGVRPASNASYDCARVTERGRRLTARRAFGPSMPNPVTARSLKRSLPSGVLSSPATRWLDLSRIVGTLG